FLLIILLNKVIAQGEKNFLVSVRHSSNELLGILIDFQDFPKLTVNRINRHKSFEVLNEKFAFLTHRHLFLRKKNSFSYQIFCLVNMVNIFEKEKSGIVRKKLIR